MAHRRGPGPPLVLRLAVVVVCAALGMVYPVGPVNAAAAVGSGAAGTPTTYQAPLAGRVVIVNAFDSVTSPYAAGHRGVDLALVSGSAALAAGAGVVQFAGQVAGRGLVVVQHPDGTATEYEPLAVAVRAGQPVALGQRLGTLQGSHSGCAVNCLHWGARRNGSYFDPLSLLRPLGIVRLLPCECLSRIGV